MGRFTKSLKICGITLGSVIALLIALISVGSLVTAHQLSSLIAGLDEAGYPSDWKEVAASFPGVDPDRSQQAAYFTAMDMVSELPEVPRTNYSNLLIEGNASMPESGEPLPPELVAALEERLTEAGPLLEMLTRSLKPTPLILQVDPETDKLQILAGLASARACARLLAMKAILAAEKDDAEMATVAIIDSLRLPKALETAPIMISALVAYACEGVTHSALERVLMRVDLSDTQMARIEKGMSESTIDTKAMLQGETVFARQGIAEMLADTGEVADGVGLGFGPVMKRLVRIPPIARMWARLNGVAMLKGTSTGVSLWNLPWSEFSEKCYVLLPPDDSFVGVFGMQASMITNFKDRELRLQGAKSCARIAMAIERYTRQEGQLPATLAELAPAYMPKLPTEPYFGKAFTYELQEEGKATLSFEFADSDRNHSITVIE